MTHHYQIIADTTADLLKPILMKKLGDAAVHVSPFGQVFQTLADPTVADKRLIVFSRIEMTLPTFQQAVDFSSIDYASLDADIDFFYRQIQQAAARNQTVFVFSWFIPLGMRGHGMADYRPGQGMRYLVNYANNRLATLLADIPNCFLLDIERVLQGMSVPVSNPRFWYAGKVMFTIPFFEACAEEIKAAVDGLDGKSRRLIVVDLDNTLWGGILGDVGWEGLRIGGHDYIGEAHADFQSSLKALSKKGIILSIASKNYEHNALEALEKHPEMVLRKDDFATWQINWQDKAENITKIAQSVNLGLSSVVFLDDNPLERARVREALPEVLVPEWPEDPTHYVSALRALNCFDIPVLSTEDKSRAAMFTAERARKEAQNAVASEEDWLKSIGMKVEIEAFHAGNRSRIAQLFNKTNQFNLATRRLNENDLETWLQDDARYLWAFRVQDRFGDSGLTGILTLDTSSPQAEVVDFIMSCRVMGRKIERVMLATAVAKAQEHAKDATVLRFLQTERNQPMCDFLQNSGLERQEDSLYVWSNVQGYDYPASITVNHLDGVQP